MAIVVKHLVAIVLLSTALASGQAKAVKLEKLHNLTNKMLENEVLGSKKTLFTAIATAAVSFFGAMGFGEHQLVEPLLTLSALSGTVGLFSEIAYVKRDSREAIRALIKEAEQREAEQFAGVVDGFNELMQKLRERSPSSQYFEKEVTHILDDFYQLIKKFRELHTHSPSVEVSNRAEMILNIFMQTNLPMGTDQHPLDALDALVDENGSFPLTVKEDGLLFNNGSFVSYTDLFGEEVIVDYTQEEVGITGK